MSDDNGNEPEEMDRTPVRLTDDEVKAFAKGLLDGRLFTNFHIPESEWAAMIPSIFMPIGLGALHGYDTDSIAAVAEWMDRAGPRSVNGYPIFMSCTIIHIDDWPKVVELYVRLQQAQDNVLAGS